MSLLSPKLEHAAESARVPQALTRTRIARALMALAAVSALAATVSDASTVFSASPSAIVVQTWRLYGFALFAGLFTFLAVNLKGHRGIWELVIANKLLLTCTAIGYALHGNIAETADVLIWDGFLTVLLISAYVTCQGWQRQRGLGRATGVPAAGKPSRRDCLSDLRPANPGRPGALRSGQPAWPEEAGPIPILGTQVNPGQLGCGAWRRSRVQPVLAGSPPPPAPARRAPRLVRPGRRRYPLSGNRGHGQNPRVWAVP
jgi:hypothetical protein